MDFQGNEDNLIIARGIQYRTEEEVFDRFPGDSDSDIGNLSSEIESEDTICSPTGPEHVILTICPPTHDPEKG